MSLVEKLTEKYSVLDTQAYGKVVCIPKKDFISDLEKLLKESGCRIHPSFMGGPVVLVPLDDLKSIKGLKAAAPTSAGEIENAVVSEEAIETIKNPPAPKHKTIVHGPSWSPQEDELLIALRNKGLIEEEVAKEFCERYPQRTPAGVHNRISRLLKAGKIKHKSELLRTAEKEQPENRPKRGRGRPPKPKDDTQSTPSTPVPAVAANPFEIKTTLTLNITVDCSDRNAVANFLEIVKKIKEGSS